jgi:membrane protein
MSLSAGKIILLTLKRALAENIVIFGGYAAYSALLAFFPFTIFLMAAAGLTGSAEASQTLINYGLSYMPAQVMEAVSPVINSIMKNESPGLMTLGGLAALWVASSGVEGIRFGLNRVYGVSEFRPLWKRRLQSAGVVFAGSIAFLLLTVAVIIWPLLVDAVSRFFFIPLDELLALNVVRFPLALILLILLISMFYRVLPHRRQCWRSVLPGAILASVLWLALAQAFSLYLSYFGNYDVTYGSIGGVIITLIFFHYSATVILLGGALNHVLEDCRGLS